MSCYVKKHISLKRGMIKPLNRRIRIWSIPGIQVNYNELPTEAIPQSTFVMKNQNTSYMLKIEYDVEKITHILTIGEFSSLEELHKDYPQLFKKSGNLYAFS